MSDLRLPSFTVFAFPVFHRFVVLEDVASFLIGLEGLASAVGNIAQVAEKRAPMALLDFGIQRFAFSNRGKEIFKVNFFATRAGFLFEKLSFGVKDFIPTTVL